MPIKRGQVLLITVFALTFALFSLFLLLAPIRDKLIRIKEMESIYQAVANGEKGLEASLLDVFKGINLSLRKQTNIYTTQNCGGLTFNNLSGICIKSTYDPIIGSLWTDNDRFRDDSFVFRSQRNTETVFKVKNIADGFIKRVVRTVFIGSLE